MIRRNLGFSKKGFKVITKNMSGLGVFGIILLDLLFPFLFILFLNDVEINDIIVIGIIIFVISISFIIIGKNKPNDDSNTNKIEKKEALNLLSDNQYTQFSKNIENNYYNDFSNNYSIISPFYNLYINSLPKEKYLDDENIYYTLSDLTYNSDTKKAYITFIKYTKYRTIERYQQVNYVKHPIYSDIKIKRQEIKKIIRINNEVLNDLENNDDELIELFCDEIIYLLNNNSSIPKFFCINCLDFIRDELIDITNKRISKFKTKKNVLNNKFKIYHNSLKNKLDKLNEKLNKLKIKENEIYLDTINSSNQRLINKFNKLALKIKKIENILKNYNDLIGVKSKLNNQYDNIIELYQNRIKKIMRFYSSRITKTANLPTEISDCDDFMLLKDFEQLTPSKIMGCYILKNNENGKYYVGQSKDIFRRIKQHFKNLVPQNMIFADDYFSSNYEKELLFSIKILPLNTKDELENTERYLIDKYNSNVYGYNKTKGND